MTTTCLLQDNGLTKKTVTGNYQGHFLEVNCCTRNVYIIVIFLGKDCVCWYLSAYQCLCPGLEITGKQQDELNKWCKNNIDSQEELFALFDYDKTGTEKKWRCYSKEAVNDEGTAYDSDKQSIKYFTRNNELMDLLGRCKYVTC